MRFVDLTAPITQSPPETPEPLRTDIAFQDHAEGAAQIEALLGVPARLMRDGEEIDVADMEGELRRIGHELAELDIVLVRTGRDAHYGEPGYMALGPGVTLAATRWLFERGVRVMGIDAWGWDKPLYMQAQEALERDEPGVFWAAHQADLPYSQIERLVNLDQLPATGFKVACFPLRIVGGSAAPARVVAILDD